MDHEELAKSACDLNLKLMKWRLLPSLNLDIAKNTKCLLLGSGSLGCQVARSLLSWGFTKITFVDNGKVAYSNPVRQCLFTFEDSKSNNSFKSTTAATRLKEIFPKVEAQGVLLKIPMPGHSFESEEAKKDIAEQVNQLEELIKSHDAIFLLTDSRESRWLPTLLATKYNKICLTVALGFDTFVVMRHGLSPFEHKEEINGKRLGCYFCNDVVAPRNSLKDRTLDQQCTVSRPALCCIASSLATELLVSLLNHPLKHGAKAHEDLEQCDASDLGILPQQLRGNLNWFNITPLFGQSFDRCVACCDVVIREYEQNGFSFLEKAFNKPDYLEDLTGITKSLGSMNLEDFEEEKFDDDIIEGFTKL